MVDSGSSLRDLIIRGEARAEVQKDWMVSSAEYGRRAEEALTKAAEVLAEDTRSGRPDQELARTWAAVGQGWATLSHAEATRSVAAAAFAIEQVGVNTYPAA
jgi:hypothetical protein